MAHHTVYTDKTIVIAGGASGMGKELARQLAPLSKHLIILDRNKTAGQQLSQELGDAVLFEEVEMKDAATVRATLERLNGEVGEIDYFFNFAGTFLAGEIRDTTTEQWHEIVDTNLSPIINGTSAIYDIMRMNGHGSIVNIASAAGLFPVPVMNLYGSTKSAVVSLTLGLRMEAKSFNIAVSVVCPTVVQTPLYDTAMYAGVNKSKALKYLKGKDGIQSPDVAARKIVKGVAKNKAIIHTAASTRFAWFWFRVLPALYLFVAKRIFTRYRNSLRQSS